jgi:hypothetical protein
MSFKSGQAYLVITQPDRVRIRLGGSPELISEAYESITWPEVEMKDGNGLFFYKKAPSLKELEQYFENLQK